MTWTKLRRILPHKIYLSQQQRYNLSSSTIILNFYPFVNRLCYTRMTWSLEKFMVMKLCVSRRHQSLQTTSTAATMSTRSTTEIYSKSRAFVSYNSRKIPMNLWASLWKWPKMDDALSLELCTVGWYIAKRHFMLAMKFVRSMVNRFSIKPLVNYRGYWWVYFR